MPILELSRDFILSAIGENITNPITNSTSSAGNSSNPNTFNALVKRDAEPCAADRPCPDKRFVHTLPCLATVLTSFCSCCSTAGKCGYGPDYCGASNCVSNCDATAMCGKYSEGGSLKCGMNLCCSHYGTLTLRPRVSRKYPDSETPSTSASFNRSSRLTFTLY